MKVLHVGKYFPPYAGGMETYLKDLMVAQRRSGLECHALVHRSGISYRSTREDYSAAGQVLAVSRAAVWLRMMFTPISPTLPWILNRLIKQEQPDLLHLHMPNVSAFWALLLPAARRLPWIIHWHSDVVASRHSTALRLFYTLYRPFERALLRQSRAVIVTSPPYAQSSLPLRDYREKTRVVPLGIDDRAYLDSTPQSDADQPPSAASNPPMRVLATGRLSYYKGFEYLIRATALTEQIEVHIVGSGDLLDELKRLSEKLGLQGRVFLHGHLPDSDLVKQYHLCDCLCLPSIERTEAFGMVLLEAMACGKPTVISDVEGSGMGWVVEHEGTGLKVSPADVEGLAGALRQLQANREKARNLGERGREKFYRQFHIDQSAAGVTRVYNEVLAIDGDSSQAGSR